MRRTLSTIFPAAVGVQGVFILSLSLCIVLLALVGAKGVRSGVICFRNTREMLRGNHARFRNPLRTVSQRGAQSVEAAGASHSPQPEQSGTLKTDPVVRYMEKSNMCFQKDVLQPLKTIFANTRNIHNYVVTSSDLQQNHPDLVDKLRRMDDETWKVLNQTKTVDRRFRTQLEKVNKKCAATPRGERKPSKSVARVNAGKLKAVSLAMRHKDFKDARQALKDEGYEGSLKVKKGMPMHNKIVELQKARASSAAGGSGSA